jgi:hypothetical protein
MEFFRHCPGCGRRFHIKLEKKELVHLDRETVPATVTPRATVTPFENPIVLVSSEGRPIVADIEEFQYTYKCGHCGHEWSEKRLEEHRER